MKKLFFCAAALLAAISFAACYDDDDKVNLPVTPESIAGTWQIVNETGWEIYDGEKDVWSENYPDEYGQYYTCTFNRNGTYTTTEYVYDNYEGEAFIENYTGSYSISGSTLIMKENYDNESDKHEIRKLTESELILTYKYADEEYSEETTLTFKRIE